MKRVYICGPMRGYPGLNYSAFDIMAKRLRELGHFPVSPAALSRAYVQVNDDCEMDVSERDIIRIDLAALETCDCVLLLGAWESSRGAAVEIAHAKFLGIPVFQSIDQMENAA